MTTHKKERKVRHRPSVVNDHQAYLHNLMAELDRAAISLRLGESLKLAGITQQEMADLLQLHKRSIEDYTSPRISTIPLDRLDEWARITRTTKEWLLHGDEAKLASPEEVQALREAVAQLQGDVQEMLEILRLHHPEDPATATGPH